MKFSIIIPALLCMFSFSACSQNSVQKQNIGGGCEGCEAIYESPMAFEKLSHLCYLPDWNETGSRLVVNGVVFNADGTPAADVIIYVYHTDQTGYYSTKGNATGWGKRHGYIRGWMKTNKKGEYKFFTRKPIAYPGRNFPAHIHVTVKEPGKNEYWIDEYVFDDDSLLTDTERKKCENRGGSGILTFSDYFRGKDLQQSERNIYLGKNIPGYPTGRNN